MEADAPDAAPQSTVDHWVVLCTQRPEPVLFGMNAQNSRAAPLIHWHVIQYRTYSKGRSRSTVEKSVLVPLRLCRNLRYELTCLGEYSCKNPIDPWRQARLPPAGPSTQSSTPNIDEAKLPLIQRPMVAALFGGRSDKGYVISELFALIRLNLVSLQTSEPSCLLPTHLHSVTTWTWY